MQQGTLLIPLNVKEGSHTFIDWDDITLEDYFWCIKCREQCETRESELTIFERPLDEKKYGDIL